MRAPDCRVVRATLGPQLQSRVPLSRGQGMGDGARLLPEGPGGSRSPGHNTPSLWDSAGDRHGHPAAAGGRPTEEQAGLGGFRDLGGTNLLTVTSLPRTALPPARATSPFLLGLSPRAPARAPRGPAVSLGQQPPQLCAFSGVRQCHPPGWLPQAHGVWGRQVPPLRSQLVLDRRTPGPLPDHAGPPGPRPPPQLAPAANERGANESPSLTPQGSDK